MNFTIRFNPAKEECQDVYVKLVDGSELFVVANVTAAGADWVADQMALYDNGDRGQLEMVAQDVRKRMPVRYSWTWQQAEARRLANMPLRRCNGTFKSQGAR